MDKVDMNNMDMVIKEFLDNWLVNAKDFYMKAKDEYDFYNKYNKALFIPYYDKYTFRGVEKKDDMSSYKQFKNTMISKFGKGIEDILHYKMNDIDKILQKEYERKYKKLMNDIDKKVGNILEANLHVGSNLDLNGVIIGDKAKVKISTICAGGYNIQCLHYRVLIKVIK